MKKKYYLTLDTETATLPFANELCRNKKEKQIIAIAKPIVYDIGWVVSDRQGNIIKQENFLVKETFYNTSVFETAYYKAKRPIYEQLLEKEQVKVDKWDNIIALLINDLKQCDLTTAYNACFDFKKAIPYTERYINAMYSTAYEIWENREYRKCCNLLKGQDESQNPDYLKPYFELRGEHFPIADLWGIACQRLINIDKYRNYCLKNELLTASAFYFKSSAETSFQYLMRKHDFIEEHTALSDALIEAQILTKALKKGKIEPQIIAFPFRELGTTIDYVKTKQPKYASVVRKVLQDYYEEKIGIASEKYLARVEKSIETLLGVETRYINNMV